MTTRSTHLSNILGVNGQAVCDCGCVTFEVGLSANPDLPANNFIRLLECTECRKQLPVLHNRDQLSPAVKAEAAKLDA